jgi:hypothetical protein
MTAPRFRKRLDRTSDGRVCMKIGEKAADNRSNKLELTITQEDFWNLRDEMDGMANYLNEIYPGGSH